MIPTRSASHDRASIAIVGLRVDFQGSRATSGGGLLLVRELDERLGLRALITESIMDDQRGKNTQLPLPDLLRQSIYLKSLGENRGVRDVAREFRSQKSW